MEAQQRPLGMHRPRGRPRKGLERGGGVGQRGWGGLFTGICRVRGGGVAGPVGGVVTGGQPERSTCNEGVEKARGSLVPACPLQNVWSEGQ